MRLLINVIFGFKTFSQKYHGRSLKTKSKNQVVENDWFYPNS